MTSSTRITAPIAAQAASFDALSRTLDRRLPRRRVVGLLAATLATGVLGTAVRPEQAAAKKKGSKGGSRKRPRPAPQPLPSGTSPAGPDASQRCLAAGDRCGTKANHQGSCRYPAVADNQAGLVCTSDQAGNACDTSTQCGAGTRCAGLPTATCRVVIA